MRTVVAVLLLCLFSLPSFAQLENPGLFVMLGFTDQSLVYYTPGNDQRTDLGALGATANKMRIFDGELWIVHSGDLMTGEGAEVWHASIADEIADAVNGEREINWEILTLDDWSNPFDVAVVGADVYVSLLADAAVIRLDRYSGEELQRWEELNAPEGLAVGNEILAIANSGWGFGTTVTMIQLGSGEIAGTIEVPDNPQMAVVDTDGFFHVICSGRSWEDPPVPGAAVRIDPSDFSGSVLDLPANPYAAQIVQQENQPEKVVLGDQWAPGAGNGSPNVVAYYADNLEWDNSFDPGNWDGYGYAITSDPEGRIYIGSATLNSVARCDYDWTEQEVLYNFDAAVTDLIYFEGTTTQTVSGHLPALPDAARLLPAYPNPFNSSTRITLDLPANSPVRLEIFDLSGRLVRTIFRGSLSSGSHDFLFRAEGLSTGSYFAVLNQGASSAVSRLILIK